MSLSAATARERWDATGGKDPLFAADRRLELPRPAAAGARLALAAARTRADPDRAPLAARRALGGKAVAPDFTLEVVRDPNGCNSGPAYGPAAGRISVYRRVRPIGNMKYLLAAGFAYDPKQGLALPRDPDSGALAIGQSSRRQPRRQPARADGGCRAQPPCNSPAR